MPASEDNGASYAEWTSAFSIAMDTLAQPLLNGESKITLTVNG